MAISVAALVEAMEAIAPPWMAEEWDNVGLLLGSAQAALTGPVLLTIDLTEAVLAEAQTSKAGAVVAYHPPIFDPIRAVNDSSARGRVLLGAARAGIAVYSPHTAIDAAPGGLADWLADAVMEPGRPRAADRRALRPTGIRPPTQQVKVVTFVPEKSVEAVRGALASAGAGLIGNYEACSFAVEGTGTFLGNARSHPAVGKPGVLESQREVRLEMVCSKAALSLALATLRQFHPYEEPAIDVYPLLPKPSREAGVGRRLVLDHPATLAVLVPRIKAALGVSHVQLADAGRQAVTRIGVCPGSGGELWQAALAEGCELYLTGEMKHHDVLAATGAGLAVVTAGHTNTERPYLPVLAQRLGKLLPGVQVVTSSADRDPMAVV